MIKLSFTIALYNKLFILAAARGQEIKLVDCTSHTFSLLVLY